MIKLKKIIKDIEEIQVKGSKEIEITGICSHSKLVAPGNLFIAKNGNKSDGSDYIAEAIEAGAAAIVTDIFDPSLKNITQIIHPKITEIEGILAANVYKFPSNDLFTIGITGTNGKTTTAFLLRHLLEQFYGPCGLIGTVEYIVGNLRYQATHTTPDVCVNHKMLREMVLHDCKSAVMEVTSHALDQKRVDGIEFDVAVFTNLTHDHLDYHSTMEQYAACKRKLFAHLDPLKQKKSHPFTKSAVLNADNSWHLLMAEDCRANILTYGIESKADLHAKHILFSSEGTKFNLHYHDKAVECHSPFVGRYNVYNYMAAAAVALSMGYSLEEVTSCLATAKDVPGRLQSVPNRLGIRVYVDFAHTDDALHNVLGCLNEIKKTRIITVFGCGGDRDKSKRPKMAEACERFSDLSIVTTDNPRSEDPEAICRDILPGFSKKAKYLIEVDRKKAIGKALKIANPGDIVLIAGKGHEPYQIFAHTTFEFDDTKIAEEWCKALAIEGHRNES